MQSRRRLRPSPLRSPSLCSSSLRLSPLRLSSLVTLHAVLAVSPSTASSRIASPHTAPPCIVSPSTSSRDTPRGPDGLSAHHSFSHRLSMYRSLSHRPHSQCLSLYFRQPTQRLRPSPLDIIGAFTLSTRSFTVFAFCLRLAGSERLRLLDFDFCLSRRARENALGALRLLFTMRLRHIRMGSYGRSDARLAVRTRRGRNAT